MPKSPVPLGKSLAKNKSSSSPRYGAKYLVYSFEIGLLHEVRESGSTEPDRVWDLFHALAIRVHARVEMVL